MAIIVAVWSVLCYVLGYVLGRYHAADLEAGKRGREMPVAAATFAPIATKQVDHRALLNEALVRRIRESR